MSAIVVLKFGGTSVADPRGLALMAQRLARESRTPLFVVSALAGVTDALLAVAHDLRSQHSAGLAHLLQQIHSRHLQLAEQVLQQAALAQFRQRFSQLFQVFESRITAFRLLHFSHKDSDELLAYGETFAAILVHEFLKQHEPKIQLIDARAFLVTNDRFGAAKPLLKGCTRRARKLLLGPLTAGIPLLTQGFIGSTRDRLTVTLGRGGSDYSATFTAALLGAEEVQIWTDVDGVLSADPRLIPQARALPYLSFQQAAVLAHFGAKVLHPQCLEPLRGTAIRASVRNSFNPQHPGTALGEAAQESDHQPAAIGLIPQARLLRLEAKPQRRGTGQKLLEFAKRELPSLIYAQCQGNKLLLVALDREIPHFLRQIEPYALLKNQAPGEATALIYLLQPQANGWTKLAPVIANASQPPQHIAQSPDGEGLIIAIPPQLIKEYLTRLHESISNAN